MSVTIADILNADNLDDIKNKKKVKKEMTSVEFNLEESMLLEKYAPIATEALERYLVVSNGEDIGMAIMPIEVTVESGSFVFLVQIDGLEVIGMIVFPKEQGETVISILNGVLDDDET